MDWRSRILVDQQEIRALLKRTQRVAVLGIKTQAQASQAAYYVPQYLASAGLEVVPVPVYYPEATHILGAPVFRSIAAIPGRVDLVDVFRRSEQLMPHLPDLLAAKPRAVWLQSGIRDDVFAEQLARAGIDVVQNRCLMVDHQMLAIDA